MKNTFIFIFGKFCRVCCWIIEVIARSMSVSYFPMYSISWFRWKRWIISKSKYIYIYIYIYIALKTSVNGFQLRGPCLQSLFFLEMCLYEQTLHFNFDIEKWAEALKCVKIAVISIYIMYNRSVATFHRFVPFSITRASENVSGVHARPQKRPHSGFFLLKKKHFYCSTDSNICSISVDCSQLC